MHATDDLVSARLQSVLRFQREDVRGFGKFKCTVPVRNQATGETKSCPSKQAMLRVHDPGELSLKQASYRGVMSLGLGLKALGREMLSLGPGFIALGRRILSPGPVHDPGMSIYEPGA